MRRLNAREQDELLLAVGGLLSNAEDPKFVKTKTAMCGKAELANVGKVWRRLFNKRHSRAAATRDGKEG